MQQRINILCQKNMGCDKANLQPSTMLLAKYLKMYHAITSLFPCLFVTLHCLLRMTKDVKL